MLARSFVGHGRFGHGHLCSSSSAVSQDEMLKPAKLNIEEWISIARADQEEDNL